MGITEFLAEHITKIIDYTGYFGVFFGMVLESMIFPIPSEAIMPFAGFLIAEGKFTFFGVIFFSTLGSLFGSSLSYLMGEYLGEPFIRKFGKYFLLDFEELEFTKKFFGQYGNTTIFISRFIPVIRHLISIPAGIAKMNFLHFTFLTIIGAGIWNTFLTCVGFYLKKNWNEVMQYSHAIDIGIVIFLIGFIGFFIYKKLKK